MNDPSKKMPVRPPIQTIHSGNDIRQWYWLKEELIKEARRVGLKTTGGKFTILERICHHRETRCTEYPEDKTEKSLSKFDWHREPLTGETVITDSYKNTQNVRRWFKANVDPGFKFNIALMEWMKSNIGKSLAEAGGAYLHLKKSAAKPGARTTIKPHNQLNQYTRDFLNDNPDMGMKEVRKYWALKRALPSADGRHVYERSDLELN